MKGRIRGSGRRCCNSRTGQTKNPSSNAATTVDVPTDWDLQQRRPLPAAETGRSCWGSGQHRMQAPLKARSRRWEPQPVALSNSPLGCCLPCCAGSCCSIPVRVKKNPSSIAATTVDIPIGWNPNTKKEPTGLFFTACGRPCSFDSSYGLHEKIPDLKIRDFIHDPYGNRTHVTAVKGPCLNRLTNGP